MEPESKQGWRHWAKWLGNAIGFAAGSLVWLWSIGGAIAMDNYWPKALAWLLATAIAIAVPLLWLRSSSRRPALIGLAVSLVAMVVSLAWVSPTHDRQWGEAQAILPTATFSEGSVLVQSVRTFRYREDPPRKTYQDFRVNLDAVQRVWFGVDRFSSIGALAHTFLSFEIREPERTRYLAFSIETRREANELTYSPIRGIYRNYETIYVIADEQDVLSLRTDVRQHEVQLYPLRATKDQARQIFVDMLNRANEIAAQAEFYNTLTNNCTNNLVSHANKVMDSRINPAELSVVFPGYSDRLAFRHGMIDTNLTYEQAREQFRVDQKVAQFDGKSDFSEFIRRSD